MNLANSSTLPWSRDTSEHKRKWYVKAFSKHLVKLHSKKDQMTFYVLLSVKSFVFHCQPSAKNFILWGVVCECLLPIASRPIKAMDQLVRFLAPVDIDSAVHHLLSAGKEESGADKLTQSAAMVSNDADVLPLWECDKKIKDFNQLVYWNKHHWNNK